MDPTLWILFIIAAILYIAILVIAPRPSQRRRSKYRRRGNSYNPSNNYTFYDGGGGDCGGGGGDCGGGGGDCGGGDGGGGDGGGC